VALDRIVLRSAGPGWPPGTILRQSPPPGTPLTPASRVELSVAGPGALESLPFPLRGEEANGFGADALFALFDSPLLKAHEHVREAGGYLRLERDRPTTALRWLHEIFQCERVAIDERWWHGLVVWLAAAQRFAATEQGLQLAFRAVFGLPVQRIELLPGLVPVLDEQRWRLGSQGSRLGCDTVIGDGAMAPVRVIVTIGPIPLSVYLEHTKVGTEKARHLVYAAALPAQIARHVQERWCVGDPSSGSRCGGETNAAVLGLTSYLAPQKAAGSESAP
jgi:hypothetical protein